MAASSVTPMPDCIHPLNKMNLREGAAYAGDSLVQCGCGKTFLFEQDLLKPDQPGMSQRAMILAKALSSDPGTVEIPLDELFNPKPSNLYPFRKAA